MTQDATIRLVGFAGSLRQGSYNRKLLAAAQRLMPADAVLEILPIDVVPLYNGDDEASTGIPRPVAAPKQAIAAADGLVIATPENNGGIPGLAEVLIGLISRQPTAIP